MVATYSEMLRGKFGEKLGPDGEEYISYIIQGALRMEQLLQGSPGLCASLDLGTRNRRKRPMRRRFWTRRWRALRPPSKSAALDHPSGFPGFDTRFPVGTALSESGRECDSISRGGAPANSYCGTRQGHEWLFSVQDNGIGIAPQYQGASVWDLQALAQLRRISRDGHGPCDLQKDRGALRRANLGGLRGRPGLDVFLYAPANRNIACDRPSTTAGQPVSDWLLRTPQKHRLALAIARFLFLVLSLSAVPSVNHANPASAAICRVTTVGARSRRQHAQPYKGIGRSHG